MCAEQAKAGDVHTSSAELITLIAALNPDDPRAGACLSLLARRDDGLARQACEEHLLTLPWGGEHATTEVLIRALEDWPVTPREALLQRALHLHQGPPRLRLWLWRVLGSSDPVSSLEGALDELRFAQDEPSRLLFLSYLDPHLKYLQLAHPGFERHNAIARLAMVDTQHWAWLSRAYLAQRIAVPLGFDANCHSGSLGRAAMGLIGAWEELRFNQLGCLLPLLMILASAPPLYQLLNGLLGPPTTLGWLSPALLVAWLVSMIATIELRFFPPQGLSFKLCAAVLYFALLLGVLLAAVLPRLG